MKQIINFSCFNFFVAIDSDELPFGIKINPGGNSSGGKIEKINTDRGLVLATRSALERSGFYQEYYR